MTAAAASVILRPVREFLAQGVILDDPDPSMAPEDVMALYAESYPYLVNATCSAARVDGDRLIYVFEPGDAKSKG